MSLEGSNKKFYLYSVVVVFFILAAVIFLPIRDHFIRKIISTYFLEKGKECTFSSIEVGLDKIKFTNLKLKDNNNIIKTDSISIFFNIQNLVSKRKTSFHIDTENFSFNNLNQINFQVDGEYNHRKSFLRINPKISSNKINNKIDIAANIEIMENLFLIKNAEIYIENGLIKFDSAISVSGSKIESIGLDLNLNNIPLNLYKLILTNDNPVYQFLNKSILSGNIDSGLIKININKQEIEAFNEKKLKQIPAEVFNGNIILSNVEYNYSSYMPNVKAKILPLNINGGIVSIDAKDIEVADNYITEGKISFDTLSDVFEVVVDAKAVGKISGLINFIEKESLLSMKKSNIDLSKVKGNVISKISLRIPTKKDIPNYYNVKSQIKNMDLNILNEMIKLRNYSLDAEFTGDKLQINGKGIVNNFPTKTNFTVNLKNKDEFSHKLDSEITITKSDKAIAAIEFLGGESKVFVNMTSKDGVSKLLVKSNLDNSEFIIPNLSLKKPIGKKAKFTIDGIVVEGDRQELSIKLEGEDSLKIAGKIFTQKEFNKIAFSEVKYLNNDFNAEIIMKGKTLSAYISGSLVDLSNADFSSFFETKGKDVSSIKINLNLEKIKLKNGINFTETMITATCEKGICPVARFYSSINNQDYIYADYIHSINPKWEIETNVLGKLLAGLGISNKVKKGVLKIEMSAPITSKIAGHQSIGNFTIYNMSVSNSKFLTRMISFISIPGLLGSLTNQNIHFDKISSDIIFENNIIKFKEISAIGQEFNFFSKGSIDLTKRVVDVKGQVVPSLYGLNQLMGSLPLLKYLFGKRGGLVFTPFFYNDKF